VSFQELPFLDVFKDVSGGNIKTPQKEFLEEGDIPVVDQGQGLVAGFVNDRSRICNAKPPVIVFGDHTRTIKYVDFKFAMGADGTKVLVPKVESDTKYLYYTLNSIEIPAAGYSRHYKFLKETLIPFPPLAEQKRIAGILDEADALRAKRRESLAQLDSLLQSTFLDMFGDPVTNPMGWDVVALGDVLDVKGGYAFKSTDYLEEGVGVPLIRIGEVNRCDFESRKLAQLPAEYLEKFERFVVRNGSILMSLTGTVGKNDYGNAVTLKGDADRYLLNQRVAELIPGATLVADYLQGVLSHERVKTILTGRSRGVRQANISNKDIQQLRGQLPPLDLQRRFAAIVESVEQQKLHQCAHLAELDTLFASLQSRAFRGDL